MSKTTVTDNQGTLKNQIIRHAGKPGISFRHFLVILPIILILLISTSYQQNHHDVNYFERADFAREVKDSLKNFLASAPDEGLAFNGNKAEWRFIKAFYRENGYRPVWIHLKGLDDGSGQLIEVIENARELGLVPDNYHIKDIKRLIAEYELEATRTSKVTVDFNIEVLLTDAAFRLMIHLNGGYQPLDSALFASARLWDFASILLHGISENQVASGIYSVEPGFIEYTNLRRAASDFVAFNNLNATFPEPEDTISDLRYKFSILALNLDRLRKNKFNGQKMLYVNIPAYSLKIFRHNAVKDTFRVIVGNPESPTPVLSGNMETIIANPVWYVPRSIAIDEILPKLKSDSNYLTRNGFSVLDRNYRPVDARSLGMESMAAENFDYTFRQNRGSDNSLGQIKFLFSNPYSVYLHDTPGKSLFAREQRAFSHGCIRVQYPERLANYLIREINSDTTRFENLIKAGQQKEFRLLSPYPVQITYITCEADKEGNLNFYKDIYGIDEKDLLAMDPFLNPDASPVSR